MKKSHKITLLVTFIVLTVITAMCIFSANANDDISVTLDGKEIEFDVAPRIIDGRTMVPLRAIFEEIGATVKWDSETQTVSARKSSKTVTMSIGNADMQIDKGKTDDEGNPIVETVALDVPSQIVSGRTLVPVRAISEAFGLNVDWNWFSKTVEITDDEGDDDTWKENEGTIDLTDLTSTGEGVEISDGQIKITAGGDFTLTGSLSDGNITVNTSDKVKIRLSDAHITSSEGPCIYFEKADKTYITITKGTENSLTSLDDESDALYSKENLEIKGDGTLDIVSKGGHGIKASDNLTIENGVINIAAEGDGIHVNDTFKLTGGEVNIIATGDGIDSESIVIIQDGILDIETCGTPVSQAAAEQTSDDAIQQNIKLNRFEDEADVEFEKSSKGINAEWMMVISGGDITINSASHGIHCSDEIEITGGVFNISSEYDKGISAHGNLTVDGEDTVIDITKSTEGIESKNILTINNGTIDIVSSDDALNATGGKSGEMMGAGFGGGQKNHPTNMTTQENGQTQTDKFAKPDKTQRNENMQMQGGNRGGRADMQMNGETMTPPENGEMMPMQNGQMTEPTQGGAMTKPAQNGEMPVPDFANNENKPQDNAGFDKGMMGGNMGASTTKDCLVINGGTISVIAGDDCLDSNGNLVINGGVIKATKVGGSFVGAESVIDPDGRATIGKDATIIAAVGSSSSQGNVSVTQNMISLYGETKYSADEKITLTDAKGNEILEYTPNGSFAAVIIISPDIETGEKYTLTVGEKNHSVTISAQNTVIGTSAGQSGFGGRSR